MMMAAIQPIPTFSMACLLEKGALCTQFAFSDPNATLPQKTRIPGAQLSRPALGDLWRKRPSLGSKLLLDKRRVAPYTRKLK